MKEHFTLTKEAFITRSMKGEVFLDSNGDKYFYDENEDNPFRFNKSAISAAWDSFNITRFGSSNELFTLEEPKPVYEDRYIWLKDYDGYTVQSMHVSDKYAESRSFKEENWYKSDMKITVKIKDNK